MRKQLYLIGLKVLTFIFLLAISFLTLVWLTTKCYSQDAEIERMQIDSVNFGGKHIKPKQVSTNILNVYKSGCIYFNDMNTYINSIVQPTVTYIAFNVNGTAVANMSSNARFYIYGECSALSYVDRTPYPKDLKQAYDSVQSMQMKADKSGVDHDALNDFVKSTELVKSKDGNEKIETGRDLSATVSAQNCVIQDLIKRVEALEKK